MIELPVTLTSTGGAVSFASPVTLGYTKNKGVYRLLITAEGEWQGLTIRCFWHLPGGTDPASSLVQDGFVDVPASVTAQPGTGCITFEGSDGEKTVTSADLRYKVGSNSGTEDGTMPEPGTPAWEQLVSETAVALEAVQKQIGNLDDLTTKAKENLVAAINEAARTGGGAGSMDLRVADGYVQYSTDGGSTWTNLVAMADLKGADGAQGPAGAPGKDGPKGDPGADGITPTIGPNGNWYLGGTDTGKPSRGATGAKGDAGATGPDGVPGKDGAPGEKGEKGDPGKTPVKGADYWTEADKQEIIDDIHPAFYIDLAGDYPNYTCPVAMDDIKAAYNSGYNLVCRCTLYKYTATLPLFVPMPAANTWVFSGAGALAAMSFPAQSLTIAIVNGTVWASDTHLASMDDIPTALKNPNALTIKIGSTTVTYDGSTVQTVTIADGTEVAY